MLSKMQKTWLWIFGGMVVVPEVLWGDLLKILKIPFLPIYGNVQIFTDKPIISYLVIIIEIIGVAGLIYIVNRKYQGNNLRYLFGTVLVILLMLLIISLFLSYAISNMRLL